MTVTAVRVGAPLRLGDAYVVEAPVVLAPMAGITNAAYRTLCREHGAGLYISEMITSRALVERDSETRKMISFTPDESPRSIQLYGVDPQIVGAAVRMIVAEDLADHVDLNFGCPVPKVTRKGGGAALPYKRRLFRSIVRAAITNADGRLPVTVKLRKGIDDDTLTYLAAGLAAQEEGASWVALHARTALQGYSGAADWAAIARLKAHLDIPVLGNGDVWEASDAVAMMAATAADGVVVGRGCLGRPWLFRNLAEVLAGRPDPGHPALRQVVATMRRHAELLASYEGDEDRAVRGFRKHVSWYLKGFVVGGPARQALAQVSSLGELDRLTGELDLDQPFPAAAVGTPRGRTSGQKRVALPEGWLEDPDDLVIPAGAELADSGG